MLKRLLALVLAGLILGCAAETPVQQTETPETQEWHDEGPNLLSLLRGATVRDRSGEISLEFASMFAIDGHPTSAWSSPPGNLEQWVTIELPVRSRLDAVGMSVGRGASTITTPKMLRFETSVDGAEWSEAGEFEFGVEPGNQWREITPTDARFVRVTTLSSHGNPVVIHVPTLLARGDEQDAWTRPSPSGTWMLNDVRGEFREDGHRVYGRVDFDPPMLIDGAWDGRMVRFAWARGNLYGVGLLSVSPGGDELNGIWWYENSVDPGNELGNPWFGTRVGPPGELQVETPSIAQVHVERDGRFPLFGLLFDEEDDLDVDASRSAIDFLRLALASFPEFRVRLEVGEYHSPDAATNHARSSRRAEGLREGLMRAGLPLERLVIVPIGSERPYTWRGGPLHWAMYSRVDFSFTSAE